MNTHYAIKGRRAGAVPTIREEIRRAAARGKRVPTHRASRFTRTRPTEV